MLALFRFFVLIVFGHGKGRRSGALASAMALSACLSASLPAFADDPFGTAAFDPNLYRPDALRRSSQVFGSWTVNCQEVVPLKHKFCNLISPLFLGDHKKVGYVLMSTDQSGRPSMLIRIVPPLAVDRPVVISTSVALPHDVHPKGKTRGSSGQAPKFYRYLKRLSVELCGQDLCTVFTKIDSEVIFALNLGKDVGIGFIGGEGDVRGVRRLYL